MLPDDAKMLYNYATSYQQLNFKAQRATFERAASILENLEFRDNDQKKMLGDIRRLQGEYDKAIEAYDAYLLIVPHDLGYLHRRALLLEEQGNYERALEDVNRLIDRAPDPQKFRVYARELRSKLLEQQENKR